MSRLRYALSGRDTCTGASETHHGCDCVAAPAATMPARAVPTSSSWFDRWVNGMRAAYLRHLITIGEDRVIQLHHEIRANDAELQRLRVELAIAET